VEAKIERHAVDGLGMVDFDVGTGGGRVVHHLKGTFMEWKEMGSCRSWIFIQDRKPNASLCG